MPSQPRQTALLLSLAAALLAGCAAHGGRALVRGPSIDGPTNLDFEAGVGPGGMPMGWFGGGPGYTISVETAHPHTGKGAARIEWTGAKPPVEEDWSTMTQCIDVNAWKGKRIRYSGLIKASNVDVGAGLWMRIDEDHKSLAFDNMEGRFVKGTAQWQPCSVVLDVPSTATRACFGVLFEGKGVVWADDLRFEEVGKDVPVTDTEQQKTTK